MPFFCVHARLYPLDIFVYRLQSVLLCICIYAQVSSLTTDAAIIPIYRWLSEDKKKRKKNVRCLSVFRCLEWILWAKEPFRSYIRPIKLFSHNLYLLLQMRCVSVLLWFVFFSLHLWFVVFLWLFVRRDFSEVDFNMNNIQFIRRSHFGHGDSWWSVFVCCCPSSNVYDIAASNYKIVAITSEMRKTK